MSLCVRVYDVRACVRACVRFLIDRFSNNIRILISEYRIVFLPEMHIPNQYPTNALTLALQGGWLLAHIYKILK